MTIAGLSLAWGQDTSPKQREPTNTVIIIPGENPEFNFDRPGVLEGCETATSHIAAEGGTVYALCGAEATKGAIRDVLAKAREEAEFTTLLWVGHAIESDDGPMLVVSNSFDPGLERRESLIGINDGELGSMIATEHGGTGIWIDTVQDAEHDPVLVGLDGINSEKAGFGENSMLTFVITKGDTQESTLLDAIPVCWQSDKDRPYSVDLNDPGDRLKSTEFTTCLFKGSRDPQAEWSNRVVQNGMWTPISASVDHILQDYDQKPVRSGPKLGAPTLIISTGYGLAGAGLVSAVVAQSQYNNYRSLSQEVPFQGTPSERTEVGRKANQALMRRDISYGAAAGFTAITTTYLIWKIKQNRSEGAAHLAAPSKLNFWVVGAPTTQQPSTVGFTYRF